MNIKQLTPKLSLNKAFLRLKPTRNQIDPFKKYLTWLLDQVNEAESEEFHKNLVADFLKNTYYAPNHFINTKGRNDLVIHGGKEAKSAVEVIMEVKRPNNRAEMLRMDNINVKAMHELLLYYLRERLTGKNLAVKYLIVTNVYEWFIFDAAMFEQAFAQDKGLVKQFMDFEAGRLSGTNTEFFYREIAHPALANLTMEVAFTYLDLRQYEQPLRSEDKADDKALIALFKLFSPEHLLKLPFANDSNTLDKEFYNELLHIIGLTEVKVGQKMLIERKAVAEREIGSLLENVINQLDSLRKIARLADPEQWGESYEEQLFQVGLELVLTWVNRILFLKLLEGQLQSYQQGNKNYLFLDLTLLPNFSRVNDFFFQVLARQLPERNQKIHALFAKVPYLNSSLFEPTELEHVTLMIHSLTSDFTLPLLATTVLKNGLGKRKTGNLNTLAYLFEFLNAYDFGSEGAEEIQEGNKPLINAAVLGLIFEKINGYKDGSFFTPGFITMYMCRETIQRAVMQKFNERKGWQCQTLDELHDKIADRREANEIINSVRICDPAVGSGHFLVSALNELIALKSNLKLLQDPHGRLLRDYELEVVNDELVIFDANGDIFKYNPKNKESLRVQETIFREKQAIIDNCLFGVDINSNSVNICRLRLWIELLKHAYYKADGQLETLPNIDINIKVGNSLVSRFALDADLQQVVHEGQWSVAKYKETVQRYQISTDYEEKHALARFMANIKQEFRGELDPKLKQLKKLKADLATLQEQKLFTFAASLKEERVRDQQLEALKAEIKQLNDEVAVAQQDPVYRQAFEWRFEFPEVLNDEGDFVGFDVIIGNPPYASMEDMIPIQRKYYYGKDEPDKLHGRYITAVHKANLYAIFFEQAISLASNHGLVSLITPYSWLSNSSFLNLRKILVLETTIKAMLFFPVGVFHDAGIATGITMLHKISSGDDSMVSVCDFRLSSVDDLAKLIKSKFNERMIPLEVFKKTTNYIFNIGWHEKETSIFDKMDAASVTLADLVQIERGCDTANNQKYTGSQKLEDRNSKRLLSGQDFEQFSCHWNGLYLYYEPEKMKADKSTARPGEASRFECEEKLIVYRFLNDKKGFICAYDNEQFYCLGSCYVLSPKQDIITNIRVLAGILNSKLVAFYNSKLFSGVKVTRTEMLRLPIPTYNVSESTLENLVNTILAAKKPDPAADTTALEYEIDQLVYALYGLTEAEIALVEAAML